MTEKSKSGELLNNIYNTSFQVQVFDANGNPFKVNARILCPDSEFRFYGLILKMRQRGLINTLTHMTAERIMFRQGHALVA